MLPRVRDQGKSNFVSKQLTAEIMVAFKKNDLSLAARLQNDRITSCTMYWYQGGFLRHNFCSTSFLTS
jgi:hypothetical protein